MSLSITNEPYQYTPSGNDMVFILSSTNAGNTGFKYYIDITADGEDTITLDALPNTNGYGVFNIKRIIESYISFDIKMAIDTVDYRTNDNKRFKVRTYSTWTGGSEEGETHEYMAWAAAFGVIEFQQYQTPDYIVTPGNLGSAQFLSNRTSMKVQSGDTGCLYFNSKRFELLQGDLVAGGDFSSGIDWTLTGNMVISGGYLNQTLGAISTCRQNVGTQSIGQSWKVTIEVTAFTGTDPIIFNVIDFGGSQTYQIKEITGVGTHTFYFQNTTDIFDVIEIYGSASSAFIINEIKVEDQYTILNSAVFTTYDESGVVINTDTLDLTMSGAFTEDNYHLMFVAIPSGPSNIASSSLGATFLNGASYYTINLTGPDGDACTMRYNIDTKCSPYTKKRLHYMNKLGGFDAYNFTLKNRKSFTTERAKYGKRIGVETGGVWRVHNYDQGITQHYANYQEKWVLNSDWLTDEEQEALMELFVSPAIFLEHAAGTYYPLIIDSNEYKVNTRLTDGLTQLELTVMLTHKNTTQLL